MALPHNSNVRYVFPYSNVGFDYTIEFRIFLDQELQEKSEMDLRKKIFCRRSWIAEIVYFRHCGWNIFFCIFFSNCEYFFLQ